MFSAILQKLTNKKAVIRLNLLRIVRSICEANEENSGVITIRKHGMFEMIEELAEADPAVLVRNMACELVKLTLDRERESSGGSRRHPIMRSGSIRSHALMQSPSIPNTPTQASRAREVDRQHDASRAEASSRRPDLSVFRPRSRDSDVSTTSSSAMVRTTSSEIGAIGGRSKLPRTSTATSTRPVSRVRPATTARSQSHTNDKAAGNTNNGATPQLKRRGHGLALKIRSDSSRTLTNVTGSGSASGITPSIASSSASPGRITEVSGRRRTRLPSQETRWT